MVLVRKDPCGIVCLLMTYGAVLYADYVVIRWIVMQTMSESYWGIFHVVIFNVITLMLFMSHSRAVFSDPGIVPLPPNRIDFSDHHSNSKDSLNSAPPPGKPALRTSSLIHNIFCNFFPEEDWTICTRCEMYRPPRAHHCRICRRCIRRMDHHCPWINNCVGEWNQKYFIQFLFYVALLSGYSILLVAMSWYYHGNEGISGLATREVIQVKQSRILHSVLLVLESILFGLFVCAIACDQFDAIFSDETLVEQVKKQGPFRPKKSKMSLLAEVCGHSHWAKWLLPCHSVERRIEPKSALSYVV